MADDKTFQALLEDLKSGSLAPCEAATEADFYDLWNSEGIGELHHLSMPLVGGALSSRLAWVFLSGYQGMIRYAFPFCPTDGWASYLLTEDRSGEFPGTTLSAGADGQILSGHKSWVAASDHADHLIVRLGKGPIDPLVCVSGKADGVKLTAREKPGFLGDMSQGFAGFDNVAVAADQIHSVDEAPPHFAVSEPWHVLMALNAFMASHTVALGGNDAITDAAIQSLTTAHALEESARGAKDFIFAVHELDLATTDLAVTFEAFAADKDPALLALFQKDRGLLNMASADLKRRVARSM